MSEGVQGNCNFLGGVEMKGVDSQSSFFQHDLQEQQLVLRHGLEGWGRLDWLGASERQKRLGSVSLKLLKV